MDLTLFVFRMILKIVRFSTILTISVIGVIAYYGLKIYLLYLNNNKATKDKKIRNTIDSVEVIVIENKSSPMPGPLQRSLVTVKGNTYTNHHTTITKVIDGKETIITVSYGSH